MTKYLAYSALSLFILLGFGCKNSKEISMDPHTIVLDTVEVSPPARMEYRASHKKVVDVLHTKLNLSFNWDSAFVHGEATLTLKPHFYETDIIPLDAKSFQIHEVKLLDGEAQKDLKYDYDSEELMVHLNSLYKKEDTLQIFIKYTAMPEKKELGGSSAISMDKGMYFINRDDSDFNKPRQLWTQGETEANSCWFPTVDKPNEKFTTDIYVTIEEKHTSISNGMKMFSVSNGDGTKTEYWKMDKPHAAYLVMLAVGPFAEYKDQWNEMEVNYFLDSTYLPYAHDIFGNTPEMLEFYSEYLGVPYPWQKYDQVVVHDYVSGAMENTTATIHGEFLQQTRRELYDYNYEDVIAHELFHHWFGDLVTCESWSNLTLNEGFATYGEYLWEEYKYGKDMADINFMENMEAYMYESQNKKVDMVRFYYEDKEDMFDSHSYSKGGLILHMLRSYLGEEAFRAGLRHYLNKHAYQSVEIHDLRIALEEVTGEDLNWFFNQWFLASGHPVLEIRRNWNADRTELDLIVEQKQNLEEFPLYTLPMQVEYKDKESNSNLVERFVINQQTDTIHIASDQAIVFLNYNPGNILLAEITDDYTDEDWMNVYQNSTQTIDKYVALESISEDSTGKFKDFYAEVIREKNWMLRWTGLLYFTSLNEKTKSDSLKDLIFSYKNDKSWRLRYLALSHVQENYSGNEFKDAYLQALGDTSIWVESIALKGLSKTDPETMASIVDTLGDLRYGPISGAIAEFYMEKGSGKDHEKLVEVLSKVEGFHLYEQLNHYREYLKKIESRESGPAISFLKDLCLNGNPWWIRMAAQNATMDLHKKLTEDVDGNVNDLAEKMSREEKGNFDEGAQIALYLIQAEKVLKEAQKKETRANLISSLDSYLEKNSVLSD